MFVRRLWGGERGKKPKRETRPHSIEQTKDNPDVFYRSQYPRLMERYWAFSSQIKRRGSLGRGAAAAWPGSDFCLFGAEGAAGSGVGEARLALDFRHEDTVGSSSFISLAGRAGSDVLVLDGLWSLARPECRQLGSKLIMTIARRDPVALGRSVM